MYSGVYNGNQKHEPDLECVLKRSWSNGLNKIIITGGNFEESQKAVEIAKTDGSLCLFIISKLKKNQNNQ